MIDLAQALEYTRPAVTRISYPHPPLRRKYLATYTMESVLPRLSSAYR